MNLQDRISFLEKNLERQIDWIRAADTKIVPLMFITTSLLGTTVAFISQTPEVSGAILFFALICIGTLLSTLYCIVMVSFPRTKNNDKSLILFEGIKRSGYKNFEKKVAELSHEIYLKELSKMCYSSSLIASRKFHYVKRGMIFLFSSIIPWILLVYTVSNVINMTDLLKR
jgi:Pycsar effector protein